MTKQLKIGEKIRDARKQLGLSQGALATMSGYTSRSSINKIELGLVDIPQSKLILIAKALNLSPKFLIEDSEDEETLPKVPLLGSIACGSPIFAEENIEEYLACPPSVSADFCLYCKGDSMIGARINDGDIVYIHSQSDVENGEIAAVLVEDEATLKRVYKQSGKLILKPENADYEPFVYVGEEMSRIKILGKAVAFLSGVR